MMAARRTAVIKQLSIALVALLEAQDRLGHDNTLDDAIIAVREQLTHHLSKV